MKKTLCLLLSLVLLFSSLSVSALAVVPVTDDIAKVDFAALETMLADLNAKLALCEQQGISVQYESCKAALIETYIGELREDLAAGKSMHTDSTLTALNTIYTEADTTLDSYLSGTVQSRTTPVYKTGTVTVEGDNLIANASDGTARKTYFVGYGHGWDAMQDMEKLHRMGFNGLQISVTPSHIMVQKDKGDHTGLLDTDQFSVNRSWLDNVLVPMLKRAEACDMAVSLLLTPHDIPAFMYDLYPDLCNENTGFQKYNIYHPALMRLLEVYVQTVVPAVKDFDSLLEICLINEPHYKSSRSTYDIPAWQEYLREHYDNIKELNKLWKTTYKSFDDVIMPRTQEASPLMYEWVQFNDAYYSAWNAWLASVVKAQAPDVPVSAKTMSYTDEASGRIMYGVNMEDFDIFTDWSECNAWNTLYMDNTWTKLCAYDILDSVSSDKPIVNSEDHIIYDSSEEYYDEQGMNDFADHCYTDVFQGAVHGRNAVMYWAWDRSYEINAFYNSVGTRPLAIARMSEATLDVQRLANEIDAMNSVSDEPDVYILFSDTTRVYSRMATDFLELAYDGTLYAGKNLKIVSDSTVKNLEDGKLLIVPNCCNIPRDSLKAIRNYLENGNEVLILGQCLMKDEYDNCSDLDDLFYIYTHATIEGHDNISPVVEYLLRFVRIFARILEKMSITLPEDLDFNFMITKNILGMLFSTKYVLIDADSVSEMIIELNGSPEAVIFDEIGNHIEGCELRCAEYDGKILVNICNYDWDNTPQNVSLHYHGNTITTMHELITDTTYTDGFTLEPYVPVLFEFDK